MKTKQKKIKRSRSVAMKLEIETGLSTGLTLMESTDQALWSVG